MEIKAEEVKVEAHDFNENAEEIYKAARCKRIMSSPIVLILIALVVFGVIAVIVLLVLGKL